MWAFAVAGSKLTGTGLEKLQITHTHVAELDNCGGGEDCEALSVSLCALMFVDADVDAPRVLVADALSGLGNNVTLADDFKKPA